MRTRVILGGVIKYSEYDLWPVEIHLKYRGPLMRTRAVWAVKVLLCRYLDLVSLLGGDSWVKL